MTLAGLFTRPRSILLVIGILLTAYMTMTCLFASYPIIDARPFHSGVPRIAFCFGLGILIYRLRPFLHATPKTIGLFTDLVTLAIPVAAILLPYFNLTPWFLAVLFAPWILGLSFQHGRAAAFLSRSSMMFLGYASFSLYMVHIPVQMVFWQAWPPPRLATMHPVLAVACVAFQLAFTIAAASAMYLLVEKPARRYVVHTFDGHSLAAINYTVRYWYWRIRGNLQTLADIAVAIAISAIIAVLWWLTQGP